MLIENLRVVDNDTLNTPDGPVVAPTTYFMDVAISQEDMVAVPINPQTYEALHNLLTANEVPTGPGTNNPMGSPA